MMNKKIFICTLIFLLSISVNANAWRKGSFLGDAINSVKETTKKATTAIKQDVKDYNTFHINVEVRNESNYPQAIELYSPSSQTPVFSNRVGAKKNKSWQIEVTAYPRKRTFNLQASSRGIINHKIFDPSKEDNIVFTVH